MGILYNHYSIMHYAHCVQLEVAFTLPTPLEYPDQSPV